MDTGISIPKRTEDSHDIMGMFKILSNRQEMTRIPQTESEFINILRYRHSILLEGRPNCNPGSFKTVMNRAGNTEFVPPELVEGTLKYGFRMYRNLREPFARAIFMMLLCSEVHPFTDGNGRISRVMMNSELVSTGQIRIIVPTVYREDYLLALRRLSRAFFPNNAHDYVLIAGTKWATMNIGATAITGTNSYGKYFAWGDKAGQTRSGNWSGGGFSASTAPSIGDPKMLPLEYDAANVLWGDPWRMPTSAEFKALKDATYWAWDGTDKGYYVYAPQSGDAGKKNNETTNTYDKSSALLFFPAAGAGDGTKLSEAGSEGFYWSSSLRTDYKETAFYLLFYSSEIKPQNNTSRYYGMSVRPVSE